MDPAQRRALRDLIERGEYDERGIPAGIVLELLDDFATLLARSAEPPAKPRGARRRK